MPQLLNVDKESWKYTNINAALKKLNVVEVPCVWSMTGASAYLVDNMTLVIPPRTVVPHPIDLRLMAYDAQQLNTVMTITVGAGAEVSFLEEQKGEGSYWKNITLTFDVAENAKVTHYRVNEDDPFSVVTSKTTVKLARDARYQMVALTTLTGFARQDMTVNLTGEGAECDVAGLALLDAKEHLDTTVLVAHDAPHGRSSQFFKTVLNGQSRGVYQGKIYVAKEAQKTDGYQLSRNILLSRLAEMDVKPELEIYADDVKCSHGTTSGELDETPLFYLMSRGIPYDAARRLLLEAFVGEVLDKVMDEKIKELLTDKVELYLK